MKIARSKITSQGQISVPAEVRKALGAIPGSVLEWERDGEKVIVRRAGKYTFDDIRRQLFGHKKVKKRSLSELDEGKAQYIRERYGRGRAGN